MNNLVDIGNGYYVHPEVHQKEQQKQEKQEKYKEEQKIKGKAMLQKYVNKYAIKRKHQRGDFLKKIQSVLNSFKQAKTNNDWNTAGKNIESIINALNSFINTKNCCPNIIEKINHSLEKFCN
jgi:transketolase